MPGCWFVFVITCCACCDKEILVTSGQSCYDRKNRNSKRVCGPQKNSLAISEIVNENILFELLLTADKTKISLIDQSCWEV